MILDKFLNLKGTCIQGYLHLENIGIVWPVESKNKKAVCPRCGLESDKLHQNHRHLVKDFGLTGYEIDDILREKYAVTAELPTLSQLTFIISIGNHREHINRLITAFQCLKSPSSTSLPPTPPPVTGNLAISPRFINLFIIGISMNTPIRDCSQWTPTPVN